MQNLALTKGDNDKGEILEWPKSTQQAASCCWQGRDQHSLHKFKQILALAKNENLHETNDTDAKKGKRAKLDQKLWLNLSYN